MQRATERFECTLADDRPTKNNWQLAPHIEGPLYAKDRGVARSDQKRENMSKGRMGDRLKRVIGERKTKGKEGRKDWKKTSREIENMHSVITLTNSPAPRKCN